MNIFVLDLDPTKCSEYHLDKHSIKMVVEYAQLLCGVHHLTGSTYDIPYKLSHKNHPSSIWVRDSYENYNWLCELALQLSKEYTYRYEKRHKSQDVIEWCIENKPNLPIKGKISPFSFVLPDDCKVECVVESYRNYYRIHKKNIGFWKKRDIPHWF